jgi:hypothetical protein
MSERNTECFWNKLHHFTGMLYAQQRRGGELFGYFVFGYGPFYFGRKRIKNKV